MQNCSSKLHKIISIMFCFKRLMILKCYNTVDKVFIVNTSRYANKQWLMSSKLLPVTWHINVLSALKAQRMTHTEKETVQLWCQLVHGFVFPAFDMLLGKAHRRFWKCFVAPRKTRGSLRSFGWNLHLLFKIKITTNNQASNKSVFEIKLTEIQEKLKSN